MPSRKEQIKQLLEDSPTDDFLRFALAKEYEKEGGDQQCRQLYEALVRDSPSYVGTYYHFGKLLERLGEPATAHQIYLDGIAATKAAGEQHAMRELMGAKLELGYDEDEY